MKGAPGLTGRPPEDPSLSVRGGYFEGGRTVRSIVSSMHVCPNSASMSCTAHDKKSLQAPFRAAASSGEPGSCYPIPSRTVASFLPKSVQPVSSLPFQVRHPRQVSAQALSLPLFISPPPLESKCKCISTVYPSSRSPAAQKNGADVPKNGCDPGPGCWCRFRTMADQLRDWECGKRVKALGFPCFEGEAT